MCHFKFHLELSEVPQTWITCFNTEDRCGRRYASILIHSIGRFLVEFYLPSSLRCLCCESAQGEVILVFIKPQTFIDLVRKSTCLSFITNTDSSNTAVSLEVGILRRPCLLRVFRLCRKTGWNYFKFCFLLPPNSLEMYSGSSSQEMSAILWDPKIHWRSQKNPATVIYPEPD